MFHQYLLISVLTLEKPEILVKIYKNEDDKIQTEPLFQRHC